MIHLLWPVFKGGYTFVKAPGAIETKLTPKKEEADAEAIQRSVEMNPDVVLIRDFHLETDKGEDDRYPLQENNCLFHVFATTKVIPDMIKKFASRYGPLGLRDEQGKLLVETTGEPYSTWKAAIVDMRHAIYCWVQYLNREKPDLTQWITPEFLAFNLQAADDWSDQEPSVFQSSIQKSALLDPKNLLGTDYPDNPEQATMLSLVKKYMKGHTTADMDWLPGKKEFTFRVVPTNLLGGLWTQLALAVDECKAYRPCENCRVWFELAPGLARTNRKYCSDACRLRLYRRIKKLELAESATGSSRKKKKNSPKTRKR